MARLPAPAPTPVPTAPIERQRPPLAKVLPILAAAQRDRQQDEDDQHGPSPYMAGRGDLADEALEALGDDPDRWARTIDHDDVGLEVLVGEPEDPSILRARRATWRALAVAAWLLVLVLLLVSAPVVLTTWTELWP